MYREFVQSHFKSEYADGGVFDKTRSLSGGNFFSRLFGATRSTVMGVNRRVSRYIQKKQPLRWVASRQTRKDAFGQARDNLRSFFMRNVINRYRLKDEQSLETQFLEDIDLAKSLKEKIDQIIKRQLKKLEEKLQRAEEAIEEEPRPILSIKWQDLSNETFDMILSTRTPNAADAVIVELLAEIERFNECMQNLISVCKNSKQFCNEKEFELCTQQFDIDSNERELMQQFTEV